MASTKEQELPPRSTPRSPAVRSRRLVWLISLAVLCLSIVAYGWLYPRALFLTIVPKPASISPAYLQAYNVACGVLIWLVFRCTIGLNQGGVKSIISLVMISGSVLATILISNREGRIALEEIQTHVLSLATSGSEENSNVPRARGEFGEIERFFKTRISQMASLTKAYERELAAIGWETILDPERLERDPTLISSNLILNEAKILIVKYKTWTYVLCESKRAVADIPISEWAKRHMVTANGQFIEVVHTLLDERWNWEGRIIAEVELVIAWLSARRDAWSVENGVLVFASESDLSRFNSYIERLHQVTSPEGAHEESPRPDDDL